MDRQEVRREHYPLVAAHAAAHAVFAETGTPLAGSQQSGGASQGTLHHLAHRPKPNGEPGAGRSPHA